MQRANPVRASRRLSLQVVARIVGLLFIVLPEIALQCSTWHTFEALPVLTARPARGVLAQHHPVHRGVLTQHHPVQA